MGLLPRSLTMLLLLIWIFWLPKLSAQLVDSSIRDPRALDALLQDYAFRAFVRPRTGIVYDGVVPSNLTGISISAIRLRRGSLRTKGVKAYKEFEIPMGVVVQPYVERLVLVYQNLGNRSTVYYPLANYVYLAPVLGLLAYNASDLSAKNLSELDIRASNQPISIKFSDVKSVPDGSVAKCVWFDLHGLVNFSSVVSGNVCSTFEQGHFSIVVESTAPSPAPPGEVPNVGGGGKKKNTTVWIVVGSVVGGLVMLILLGVLAVWVQGYKHRKKMQQMEKAAEVGEALHMTSVGNTKAPAATVTRTQPTLESEYVP
ncbi:transmembrane protein, putative [Actinidia rufa]|uniref:Transmembrane protein, putative n=1 Tax=Actinidia rufa TaxID=165716 RepID=A0A7J0EA34_9ERIC|nr:transmembrane protein, putative [Actinidia rufa]